MPGVVKSLDCKAGDFVEEGTVLVTLEAMKMLNPLPAPRTGTVRGILDGEGMCVIKSMVYLSFRADQGSFDQSRRQCRGR